jgi:hypothetical protein
VYGTDKTTTSMYIQPTYQQEQTSTNNKTYKKQSTLLHTQNVCMAFCCTIVSLLIYFQRYRSILKKFSVTLLLHFYFRHLGIPGVLLRKRWLRWYFLRQISGKNEQSFCVEQHGKENSNKAQYKTP